MKLLLYILPFITFAQSNGIPNDNAIVVLGDLQQDISFGHDCDDLDQMVVYVDGDVELNDKTLAIRKCKIIVNGNIKVNGIIINQSQFHLIEQLKFECGNNSIIELV